jgi:hypothetical protein
MKLLKVTYLSSHKSFTFRKKKRFCFSYNNEDKEDEVNKNNND